MIKPLKTLSLCLRRNRDFMQRFLLITFFLFSCLHAQARHVESAIPAQKPHIGLSGNFSPNMHLENSVYLIEVQLGYILFLVEKSCQPLYPLGYVDGMSLYGGYFGEGFGLDPSGLMTQSEEECIYQMQNVQGMTYEEAKEYCCEKKKEPPVQKPQKKCVCKAGPKYTPNGVIVAGADRKATFKMEAEFEHDPKNGIYAECCEIRQYIKWDKLWFDTDRKNGGNGVPHTGFDPKKHKHGGWHEDRDQNDKRYGHRKGPHTDPIKNDGQAGDEYLDKNNARDMLKGIKYLGHDTPSGFVTDRGNWHFKMIVIDVCNGKKQVGKTATVTVKW